jgi:hypothetical protein
LESKTSIYVFADFFGENIFKIITSVQIGRIIAFRASIYFGSVL